MSKLHQNGKASVIGSDPKVRTAPKPSKNETPKTGRDATGRFAPGNAGGPGNPMARKVAALRKALLDATTSEHIMQVAEKLRELALQGDVAAAKLFYSYTLGKPTPPPCDLDRVNQHEWLGYEAEVLLNNAITKFMDMPTPEVWLLLVRLMRETNAEKLQRSVFGWVTGSEKEMAKFQKKRDDGGAPDELAALLENMGQAKNWEQLKAAAAQPVAEHGEIERPAPSAAAPPPPSAQPASQEAAVKTPPTPSANGGNGVQSKQKQPVANGKKPASKFGNAAKTPSPNGSNRVAAWLPKGQRSGTKIVPRF